MRMRRAVLRWSVRPDKREASRGPEYGWAAIRRQAVVVVSAATGVRTAKTTSWAMPLPPPPTPGVSATPVAA